MRRFVLCLLASCMSFTEAPAGSSPAGSAVEMNPASTVLREPLSKAEAFNIAIKHNGRIVQAQKQVEAEYGVAIATKAITLPQVSFNGAYSVEQDSLVQADRGVANPLINNQTWNSGIQVVQSIYAGGRLLTAVRSSRLIRQRAMLVFQSTLADTLLTVSNSYDDVLRDAQLVQVNAAAVQFYGEYLNVTKDKNQAGVVTSFDVLRAEVEVANNEALLVQAQGNYRTSKQTLVELLGFNLPVTVSDNLPLYLTTPLVARPFRGDLSSALLDALQNRTEIAALEKEVALRNDDIINARAGYKPSVQAFAGYDLTSRTAARDAGDPNYGALVGAQVSWSIFDGFLTKGNVDQAIALSGKASEAKAETTRIVELQVRSNWSDLRTARAVLDAQTVNIDRAERALSLAQTRYNEGAGTQIDVFSAQNALTQARGSYVEALRDYSVAYTSLLRATGRSLATAQ